MYKLIFVIFCNMRVIFGIFLQVLSFPPNKIFIKTLMPIHFHASCKYHKNRLTYRSLPPSPPIGIGDPVLFYLKNFLSSYNFVYFVEFKRYKII